MSCPGLFYGLKIRHVGEREAEVGALSMGFSRQEYWGRLPFPSPGDLSDSEIEPASPALASRVFTSESLG